MAFDLIGDIHGHVDELEILLARLDYQRRNGIPHHPRRTAIFLGDFIDRGPQQRDTLRLVRSMIDEGYARSVMGNHEFNAIAYHTPDPSRPGEYLRPRNDKNKAQHAAFLAEIEVDSAEHAEWVDWFLTLPLWLDLGGVRVVHACWHDEIIAKAQSLLGGPYLTREMMPEACRRHGNGRNWFGVDGSPPDSGSELFHCLETLLKGIEVELPDGATFKDKDGHLRQSTRVRWWLEHPATFREAAFLGGSDAATLPETLMPSAVLPGNVGGSPVFVGHYWLSGDHAPLAPKIASVDYSVARNGPLVAYRWNGEEHLSAANFVSSA